MKRTVLTALVAGLCLAVIQPSIWAAALTPAEQAAQNAAAFAEAQALAKGAVNGAASGINDNSIANTINGFSNPNYQYSDTAPEAALFQGGNGNTQAAGVSKINDCQNGPVDPDAFKQQNCDAINYMAKQPATRPQFDVSNDPNIARSRAITANASSLAANSLGFVDPNAVGAFSGCTTKTTTMAASTITEVCHDFTSSVSQSCALGRSVVVSANTNYQCDKTTNTYLPQTCDKTVNVVVTKTAQIAATLGGGKWVVVGGGPPFALTCPTNNKSVTWYNAYLYTYLNWRCNQVGCYNGSRTQDVCPYDYTCPAGTTRTGTGTSSTCVYPAVVTSSVGNGCAAQEAAAL